MGYNKQTQKEMKKNVIVLFLLLCGVVVGLTACGNKKKSKDIITQRVVKVAPKEPVSMQEYTDERDIKWVEGRSYHVAIHRKAADSLPVVKDETGQAFVDNEISLAVTRQDGSVFFSRVFTKTDFDKYLNDDYRRTGILEGFVFDKVNGDWLEFAASVCHPQTDEYIPLIVRLSRMGNIDIQLDSDLDTSADSPKASEETEEDDI